MKIRFELDDLVYKELYNVGYDELRYSFLQGSIFIEVNDLLFSMDWNWIPLFDFSESLKIINKDLEAYNVSKFNFTEEMEFIYFSIIKNEVEIKFSFDSTIILVSVADFYNATNTFIKEISDLIKENCKFDDKSEIYKYVH